MTPFTVIEKLFGPYFLSPNSRKSLNDKMDLYFHDFSIIPLMVQVSPELNMVELDACTDSAGACYRRTT